MDFQYLEPEDYEVAERNGIAKKTAYERVNNYGWTVEDAITEPVRTRRSYAAQWERWKSTAKENGIRRELFVDRMTRRRMSEEEAATTPIDKGGRPSKKWTAEEIAIAEKNGVADHGMNIPNGRLGLGWTREDAINTPKISEEERRRRSSEGMKKYNRERGANRKFVKII